jgi:Ca2+-binding EF-hand superfamily protein
MRTTSIRWTLISALAALPLAACSGAGGDPSPADVPEGTASAPLEAPPQGGAAHHDPAKFVQHFDKNGDGKLELSELPERMQKFLGKADANGDGVLSMDELAAAKETFMKAHFAKMDKSGDGALTADEVGDKRWARLSVADADGNGSVTFSEMQAALQSGKLVFPHHRHHMGDRSKDAPAPVGS